MSISPTCEMCGKEISEFGALVLSPPDKNNNVKKHHICRDCYKKGTIKIKVQG